MMLKTYCCLARSCSFRNVFRLVHSTDRTDAEPAKDTGTFPSITMQEYKARRGRLLEAVRKVPSVAEYDHHLFVLPSAQIKYMAFHVPYTFHQDSYFRYLCGFPEPNAALIIAFNKHSSEPVSHLFVESRSSSQVMWDGPLIGVEGAQSFLTDNVHEMNQLEVVLSDKIKESSNTAVWFPHDCKVNVHLHHQIHKVLESTSPGAVFNPYAMIDLLRLVKSPMEISAMRTAARIGVESMSETIRFCGKYMSDMSEFKLWAKMDFESRLRGSHLAYPPVVGGGNNANTIHYLANNQPVSPGQLVLMDAGSQCDGYVSDITRTWPVNGRFTDAQRIVYEVVLKTLDACTAQVAPDTSLNQLYHHMLRMLSQEFKSAGVIKTTYKWENDTELGHQICPHHIGHWLGLDVHDTPSVSTTLGLMNGVVFPLEPGAYFPNGCSFVKPEFRGIGIRIEDDIAMTSTGIEVLTRGLVRTPDEIEVLMSS